MDALVSIVFGIGSWHFYALISLALTTGKFPKNFVAPRYVILSRLHMLGVLCAVGAVLSIIVGMRTRALLLGVIAGVVLCLLDLYFIRRALGVKPKR